MYLRPQPNQGQYLVYLLGDPLRGSKPFRTRVKEMVQFVQRDVAGGIYQIKILTG